MARLNVDKAVEAGRKIIDKHEEYGLYVSTMYELANKEDIWNVIVDAFYLGVCQGAKTAKKK